MAHSSRSGIRSAPGGAAPTPRTTTGLPAASEANGQRGVPANYGGRHHMAGGAAPLSAMLPRRPSGMNPAARQYGGRHHYGAEIEARMAREAASPDNVVDRVMVEMFGADDEEALFAEAEALLAEADAEG